MVPSEKRTALKILARKEVKTVADYMATFRGGLPNDIKGSMKYSFSVFLVPRVVNRENAADAAVQFVKVDEANAEELERLTRLNVLIKEKHIPIANVDLFKPGKVVEEVRSRLTRSFTMGTHTQAWKHFAIRPKGGAVKPEHTVPQYCVYDPAHKDYLYTKAWIELLVNQMSDEATYDAVTCRRPVADQEVVQPPPAAQ
jgi:hypothetical protein